MDSSPARCRGYIAHFLSQTYILLFTAPFIMGWLNHYFFFKNLARNSKVAL